MTTGCHGKIPCYGDFVSTGLPPTFTRVIDDWAGQLLLAIDRDSLIQSWKNFPTYSFSLSPGLAGDVGWYGIISPSQDRVGRNYPIIIAHPLPASIKACALTEYLTTQLEQIHQFHRLISAPNYALRSIQQDLQVLSSQLTATTVLPRVDVVQGEQSSSSRIALKLNCDVRENPPTLLDTLMRLSGQSYSMWLATDDHGTTETLLCEGLPEPSLGLSLIDGEFKRRGWGTLVDNSYAALLSRPSNESSDHSSPLQRDDDTTHEIKSIDPQITTPKAPLATPLAVQTEPAPFLPEKLEIDDDPKTAPWDE